MGEENTQFLATVQYRDTRADIVLSNGRMRPLSVSLYSYEPTLSTELKTPGDHSGYTATYSSPLPTDTVHFNDRKKVRNQRALQVQRTLIQASEIVRGMDTLVANAICERMRKHCQTL